MSKMEVVAETSPLEGAKDHSNSAANHTWLAFVPLSIRSILHRVHEKTITLYT